MYTYLVNDTPCFTNISTEAMVINLHTIATSMHYGQSVQKLSKKYEGIFTLLIHWKSDWMHKDYVLNISKSKKQLLFWHIKL